jgi:4-hydroxy-tetrahydrodipicolinate synthase
MFCGLSAFPLTPMNEEGIDEGAFGRLVERLAAAKVDSIGALGSAGNYAYLDRGDRFRLEGIERQELESLLAKLELTE